MTPLQILDKYTTVIETEFGYTENQIIQMIKEYATLCCEAQRKACAENANMEVSNSLYEGYTGQDIIEGNCNNAQYIKDGIYKSYLAKEFHVDIEDDDYKDYYWEVTIKEDSILNTPITLL